MNDLNQAVTALSTARMANAMEHRGEAPEPWARQWWVDLYTTEDNELRARARLVDLRTESPVVQSTVTGRWELAGWLPFTPPRSVVKTAERLMKKNLR